MSTNTKSVAITLKLRDSEETRRGLIALGAEGKRALDQITAASNPASKALDALNVVGGRASGAVAGLAQRGGVLSEALGAFGPIGVGIGATVGSVVALGAAAKHAATEMAEIKKSAEMAGVTTDAFQRMEYAGRNFGITTDGMTDGLKELALRADEFAVTGKGSAEETFKRLGYTQKTVNEQLKDTPAFLMQIADKMAKLDKASQIRIADELFGGQAGEQFTAMLARGGAAIKELGDEAQRLGYVIDADLINKGGQIAKEFDMASGALSRNFMSVLMECAPLIEGVAFVLNDLAKAIAETKAGLSESGRLLGAWLGDTFSPDLDQQIAKKSAELAGIQNRLMLMDRAARQRGRSTGQEDYERGGLEEIEGRLTAEIEALTAQRDELLRNQPAAATAPAAPKRPDVVIKDDKKEKKKDMAAETVADLRREVEQLTALAEAHRENAAAVQLVDDAIAADKELKRAGVARNSELGQSIIALTVQQQALQREVKAREQAEQDGAAMTEKYKSASELYGAEVSRINHLLNEQVISQQTANAALARAQQDLEAGTRRQLEASREWSAGATVALRDYVDQVTDSAASTKQALTRGLTSVEDFFVGLANGSQNGAEAFRNFANSIISDLARMMVQRSITAPLAAGLSGIFSEVFKPAATPNPGAGLLARGFASGGDHPGGWRIVGEEGPELEFTGPSRIFNADETRRVLSAPSRPAALLPVPVAAGGGAGGGGVVVNVYDQRTGTGGDPVGVQQSTGGGGMRQIDVYIADKVEKGIRGGAFDGAMGTTYGVRRQGVRR